MIRLAALRYVAFPSQMYDDYNLPTHPFGFSLLGLSEDEMRNVELVHCLFSVAEKVGYQQYERASRLLVNCK